MDAQAAAAAELKKALARYDAFKADEKEYGKEMANINFCLADMIDQAGRHWCGDWMRRGCHTGGRLGSKCVNPEGCGSYMMTPYDAEAQAKYDEWFKDTKFYRVTCYENTVTKELFYKGCVSWLTPIPYTPPP